MYACTHPGCSNPPYKLKSALGNHRLLRHGIPSDNPDSIARDERRAAALVDRMTDAEVRAVVKDTESLTDPEVRAALKAILRERRGHKRAHKSTATARASAEPLPAPVDFQAYAAPSTRVGPLDRGDLEMLRRRLVYLIAGDLSRWLKRSPDEVCISISELTANRLKPRGRISVNGQDGYSASRR